MPPSADLRSFLAAHKLPVLAVGAFALAGVVLGPLLPAETWSLGRKLLAGGLGGLWCGLLLTASRLIL